MRVSAKNMSSVARFAWATLYFNVAECFGAPLCGLQDREQVVATSGQAAAEVF